MERLSVSQINVPKNLTRTITKKSNKPALKHSNFFMTINTQQNVNTMHADALESLKSRFQDTINELFVQLDERFVILKGSKEGSEYGWPLDDTREKLWGRVEGKPKVQYSIEIGPISGKLHAHIMFSISKRGLDTKLDYSGIKSFIDGKLGNGCHFNAKLFRDAKAELLTYISKNPVE